MTEHHQEVEGQVEKVVPEIVFDYFSWGERERTLSPFKSLGIDGPE